MDKHKKLEKISNGKTKEMLNEIEKRKKDDDKIELLTQFMLDPSSAATKLLEKRREMYELQDALQRDKDKFVEKKEQFKKTEEELRTRDEDFHKKIVDYYQNTFKKKKDESDNYNQKFNDEIKRQRDLETSIKDLTKTNERLRLNLDKMKEIQHSLKKYETFLNKIQKEYSENFSDINDIISNYRQLKETYDNIKDEYEKARRKKEDDRVAFKKQKSEYETRINNIISSMQNIEKDLKVSIMV
jgi:methyl-accepting chemotaxis protein